VAAMCKPGVLENASMAAPSMNERKTICQGFMVTGNVKIKAT
jgi:hypothetical protein